MNLPPEPRRARPLARLGRWTLCIVYPVSLTMFVWSDFAGRGRAHVDLGESISLGAAFTVLFVVGITVAFRRPEHPIGWLFAAVATYTVTQAAVTEIGMRIMEDTGDTTLVVIGYTAFSWPITLATLVVVIPLLFPTGRLPSPRWRWVGWTIGTAMSGMALLTVFQRELCLEIDDEGACARRLDNPIGISWVENPEEGGIGGVLFGLLVVCLLAAGWSVVVRYRRATGVERAQLRWFTWAAGLFLGYIVVVGVLFEEILRIDLEALLPPWIDLFGIFLALVPISVGAAILRFRLYDIDRIISRTLSWGLVTATLAAVYVAGVFLLRDLLPVEGQLAVAASTLGVAALFDPLRRWVQAAVDRRFNRTRYDARRTIDTFGGRLRTATELDTLTADMLAVVSTTVQPASGSLWLRDRSLR